mgnify:CR=1 FL=1
MSEEEGRRVGEGKVRKAIQFINEIGEGVEAPYNIYNIMVHACVCINIMVHAYVFVRMRGVCEVHMRVCVYAWYSAVYVLWRYINLLVLV